MGKSYWSAESGFEVAAWLLLSVARSPASPSPAVFQFIGLAPREYTVSTPESAFYYYIVYHCPISLSIFSRNYASLLQGGEGYMFVLKGVCWSYLCWCCWVLGGGVDFWTSANNHWCVVLKMRVGGE